jgi:hypothetical protein
MVWCVGVLEESRDDGLKVCYNGIRFLSIIHSGIILGLVCVYVRLMVEKRCSEWRFSAVYMGGGMAM